MPAMVHAMILCQRARLQFGLLRKLGRTAKCRWAFENIC